MTENHSLPSGSGGTGDGPNQHSPATGNGIDGFVHTMEDDYSLYTGLAFRDRFRPFRLREPCFRVVASRLKKAVRWWLTNVVVSIVTIVAVIGLSLGLGLHAVVQLEPRPSIDFSLKAFTIPNHEATRHQEAFAAALEELSRGGRPRRSVSDGREITLRRQKRYTLHPTQYNRYQRVHLVYLAVGTADNNIFTRERIQTVHRVETDVVTMPGFSDFCFKSYPQRMDQVQRCDALDSLVSKFFYRSLSSEVQMVEDFDGAVREALSSRDGFLYTDGHANKTYFKSTFLRSEVTFGIPLPGSLYAVSRKKWTAN